MDIQLLDSLYFLASTYRNLKIKLEVINLTWSKCILLIPKGSFVCKMRKMLALNYTEWEAYIACKLEAPRRNMGQLTLE